jgi:hypothetical protein
MAPYKRGLTQHHQHREGYFRICVRYKGGAESTLFSGSDPVSSDPTPGLSAHRAFTTVSSRSVPRACAAFAACFGRRLVKVYVSLLQEVP